MSDQEKFQELTRSIGQKLWSIMPKEADEIYFQAALYSEHEQYGAHWRNRDGSLGHFDWENAPEQVERDLANDLWAMMGLDIFARDPWNHCVVTLTEAGKINFQYAYVPDADSWNNLFLRGVSDLTDAEIREYHFPMDLWEQKIANTILELEQEAQASQQQGYGERAARLVKQAEGLKARLASYRDGAKTTDA